MEGSRETRFTAEILEIAARRLNAIKERLDAEDPAGHDGQGVALVNELGWAVMGVAEMADDEVAQITALIEPESRLVTAFVDGLLLGALAADITYERSHGLTTCS